MNNRHPAQTLALAFGAVYLLVGILGFFYTGFGAFAARTGDRLFGLFEVNPLHNLVHIVVGFAGLVLWRTLSGARTYGWLLVAGYGVVLLYGLFTNGNLLSLNAADNVLHLLTVIAGLAIALWPPRTAGAPTTRPAGGRTTL